MASSPLAPEWLRFPDDANALDDAIWPSSAVRDGDGAVWIGGVPVAELAERFGTPLYVMDRAHLRDRADEVASAFREAAERHGTSVHVYYAGKAFLSTAVAGWMNAAGLRIDVCSGGEFAVARAAGVDPADCGFHGNNKSDREIAEAVESGIGAIVLDSAEEVGRVADVAERLGRVQPVRLRVNSGVHAHTHEFLATAHEDQKFGVTLAEAPAIVAEVRSRPGLSFLGLHCHIGSQIFGAEGFSESASRLLDVHERLLADGPVPELNLGGGFGVAYTSSDSPTPIADLAEAIIGDVAEQCARRGIPVPVLAFEPGRSVIAQSTVTLYETGTVKDVEVDAPGGPARRRYVSVDGGMSDNARPALYGADYAVRVLSRASAEDAVLVRIAGKHCESGDIVVDADYLPGDVRRGDLLGVPVTGAYCWELSSNYNFLPRPAVVAVEDGRARVIVRGETADDLLARDAGWDQE
ncbi:diaminopimelate decarboxylase [Mycetocola reblochoni]|uniref:Diaminopimelate decarboxylase n=2 Tax=Mycetocola reblochoni TaxID=331618 RepID=A0A1R4JSP3_9MICO|nr:diaminopimelate decarboxylase [Mycetocola reblochoni]RLP70399.1 diaminopimelate decarboxylase [Mycetocola reblochoni]SJN35281.1 Diaminopimelate decarboxylase [Mycetocola reblochoni REB411]